jgi:hypothetical protein
MPVTAALNSEGQLVSEVDAINFPEKPPINVNGNSNLVDDLNADKLDGLDKESFLRTDQNSAVDFGNVLTVNGRLEINSINTGDVPQIGELNLKPGGILRLGWFEIKTAGNLMYFEYSPQEYITG